LATTSTCNWLPLRCCRASACCSSCCFCSAPSVPVVSTTGEVNGGIAAACCAHAGRQAHNRKTSASARRSMSISYPWPWRSVAGSRRSRWRGGGRRRRRGTEIHNRRFGNPRFVFHGEIGLLLVAEHHRGEVLRERTHVGVVVLHRGDVAATGHGDAVL